MSNKTLNNDLKKERIMAQLGREIDRLAEEGKAGEITLSVNMTLEGTIGSAVMGTGKIRVV